MATGVNSHERNGSDAIVASLPHSDPHTLPPDNAEVRLEYPGKLDKSIVLQPIKTEFCTVDRKATVERCCEITANAVVLSDNMFALHSMLEQSMKATLIYLDPPFSTGMDFHSRHLEHAYTDKLGQAAYLEFMRRRLILLRELLTDDGSIYLHIGHQMLGHLKALMDEVFGQRNFRNIITRRKCSSKNFTRKQFANIHDYILFYSKSNTYKWHQPGETPDDEWIAREYPKIDKKGRYKLVPIHAPGTRNGETGKTWRDMLPPSGKHWQFKPSKLEEFDKCGEIHWSRNGNPRRKVYLQPDKKLALTEYWAQLRDAHHQSIKITGYPTEKNLDMLKLIVNASSDKGDLVLDPFCGSGTTLDAAHQKQRKWIGIDESFAAIQASVGRLRNGTQVMGDFVKKKKSNKSPQSLDMFTTSNIGKASLSSSDISIADFNMYVDTEILDEYWPNVEKIAKT